MPNSVAFIPGQTLTREDLQIILTNADGQRQNAYEISYAIFDNTSGTELLIGSATRTPENPEVGEYYANIRIPEFAPYGDYVVRWTFKQFAGGPDHQVAQEFGVVPEGTQTSQLSIYTEKELSLINSLRIMLRDSNPDRNYHFRPPSSQDALTKQTRVFGYIWEDAELKEAIERGIDMINLYPPQTYFSIATLDRNWTTIVLTAAAIHALTALSINWVCEEFSVGGEEHVDVKISDMDLRVSLEDLYYMFYRIFKKEYQSGQIKIKSLQDGSVCWKSTTNIMQHDSIHKNIFQVILENGRSVVVTSDHSLFTLWDDHIISIRTDKMSIDTPIVVVDQNTYITSNVKQIKQLPNRKYMYDISVPDTECFVLADSGILAHNSYSIGGISLDLDKSSKYQSLADTLQSRLESMLEQAHATVRYTKGLQQPRSGVGVRSHVGLGPHSGPSVISARNFMWF